MIVSSATPGERCDAAARRRMRPPVRRSVGERWARAVAEAESEPDEEVVLVVLVML